MIDIRPMQPGDYPKVWDLWKATEGVSLNEGDGEEDVKRFLARNPLCSFVALAGSIIIGAVLGGHDQRRGFLYHLAVSPPYRRRGIGSSLVEHCLAAFRGLGIPKCHVFVMEDNHEGQAFWSQRGWRGRPDLLIMSRPVDYGCKHPDTFLAVE